MSQTLAKQYNPAEVEDRIYDFWMQGGYFHAAVDPEKTPYTIVIPPPNITGQLHMGHALDNTLQDILIRYKRMQGFSALWVPGTDHASIATEAKIVEAMKAEGVTKQDLGRDGFLERAWEWKRTYGGRIVKQLQKIGCSCDWERERFTLDEGCNKAVNQVFVNLYNKGLIYRGERIINWCPHCVTSLSDAEVEFSEKDGHFWHLRYPLADGSGELLLATTRPETMLGDTAVAVHPDDERYQSFIGKEVILPLCNRTIPVIADTYVEPDFGTGVVKITPAHDPNDFEVGLRHNLPVINVMTDQAVINENGGVYEGLERYTARKAVLKDLEAGGYLVKTEDMKHNVGACYRCQTVVEPRVSEQWFVNMEPLAAPAIQAVKGGDTKFIPERFEKTYFHWMENIKDWCISRQLWWGHRIPAWYCACGETVVSAEAPDVCPACGNPHLVQDEDTLDTWFSSALWPFSTLGWPENTEDLQYFYPTNTLVTGYDIIFFWVARMIFSGMEHTGQAPFDTVFIHGLVRDEQGRKMSKSLGNGVDPLEIVEKYGADALRFTLVTGNSPGNDMRFSEKRVEASRNFANKLWNAARFVLMHIGDEKIDLSLPENLAFEDKWVLSKLNTLIKEVTDNLDKFELGLALSKLYDFTWDVFCDWYIELCKIRLSGEDAMTAKRVLVYVLTQTLALLHPFIPFITEEIWQTLPHEGDSLMTSKLPAYSETLAFASEETEMERVVAAIKAIRNRRSEMNVPPSKKAKVYIETAFAPSFEQGVPFIQKLAFASECIIGQSFDVKGAVTAITDDAKILMPQDDLIDKAAEQTRLQKELDVANDKLAFIEKKLSNEGFLAKAPKDVVASQQKDAGVLKEKIAVILKSMEELA